MNFIFAYYWYFLHNICSFISIYRRLQNMLLLIDDLETLFEKNAQSKFKTFLNGLFIPSQLDKLLKAYQEVPYTEKLNPEDQLKSKQAASNLAYYFANRAALEWWQNLLLIIYMKLNPSFSAFEKSNGMSIYKSINKSFINPVKKGEILNFVIGKNYDAHVNASSVIEDYNSMKSKRIEENGEKSSEQNLLIQKELLDKHHSKKTNPAIEREVPIIELPSTIKPETKQISQSSANVAIKQPQIDALVLDEKEGVKNARFNLLFQLERQYRTEINIAYDDFSHQTKDEMCIDKKNAERRFEQRKKCLQRLDRVAQSDFFIRETKEREAIEAAQEVGVALILSSN